MHTYKNILCRNRCLGTYYYIKLNVSAGSYHFLLSQQTRRRVPRILNYTLSAYRCTIHHINATAIVYCCLISGVQIGNPGKKARWMKVKFATILRCEQKQHSHNIYTTGEMEFL